MMLGRNVDIKEKIDRIEKRVCIDLIGFRGQAIINNYIFVSRDPIDGEFVLQPLLLHLVERI